MEKITLVEAREGNLGDRLKLGIITVSDRASIGEYEDEGGPAILEFFKDALLNEFEVNYSCVPDERNKIRDELIHFCDVLDCDVVVTTGGIGPAHRYVRP